MVCRKFQANWSQSHNTKSLVLMSTLYVDFLGVTTGPSATQDELNRAYKETSRKIHPDKFANAAKAKPYPPKSTYIPKTRKAADERFARLGLVAKVLRGSERERYDHFLRNGFPAWRGTGYYYNRFRPGFISVLIGLWVVVAGGAHYLMMYVNQQQQKRLMEHYIADARKAAWGKDSVAPGVQLESLNVDSGNDSGRNTPVGNRKQRRYNDKMNQKEKTSGTSTPVAAPIPAPAPTHAAKRKVTSDNGKTFMVTSLGDVSLVDTDEDGNTQEYLLDVNEIPGPQLSKTYLFTVPKWAYSKVLQTLGMKPTDQDGDVLGSGADGSSSSDEEVDEKLKKRGLKKRTRGPGRK